jgi:hypothetical protein
MDELLGLGSGTKPVIGDALSHAGDNAVHPVHAFGQ